MAYFALLWKARTIEQYRHIYEQEKMNSIMLTNSESHKKSLLQKFRHYRYDTRKRVGNLFRKCCPEGSKMGNLMVYLRTDQTFPNFVMKSVIGFVGGIKLTYLCFMFFVFQLAISLVHATIMSSIIGVLLTLGLAFSYRVRCLVFLLIPQFFSKVGRYTLTCYALVLILTGPATNTLRNSEVLSESMACGQEQVKTSLKQITDSIKKPFNSMKDTIKIMIERVKHVATKLKETLLKIHRLVMSIVRVLQSAFSWLSSIVGICNKKVGTPYVRCRRALGDGVLDCQAKLGPYFAWLCNIIYVAEAACYAVRPLDLICVLVEFVNGTIVATVKRKLNTFSNHIKTMLYVSVRVHHSYSFSSNSSRSASQVAAGIVTEIRHRAEPLLTWLSWSSCVTSLFLCLIIFRAKYYQHMYETRSRYDNRYVTKELRNLDLKRVREDRETVLPLNRRERVKYVTTTSFRLVASERLYLTRSVVFMGITTFKLLVHMVADYSLYWVLVTIRYHGRFQTPQLPGVPNAGVEVAGKGPVAGMVRSLVGSLSVPLTTPVPSPASCLPDPYPPDFQRYMQIGVLIFLLWFFALFEPYGLRLRHVIMGHYRPERAKARAVWLYNHILRTRGGFLKLARRKLHRDYKYHSEERFTFRQWLDAHIPCMWLRYLLGTTPKGAHCLLCNTMEHVHDPDTQLIHCETLNCPGSYCSSCFSDIGQLCTICLTPRDYGDISDVSLEKGSSEESSSDEEVHSDSDSQSGEKRTVAAYKQKGANNYNSFNDTQPTKMSKSRRFNQRSNEKYETQEPHQTDRHNQNLNDEMGNSIVNNNSLGDIQPSKMGTSRRFFRRQSNRNHKFNQKAQQRDDNNDDEEKYNPDEDLINLKQKKSIEQRKKVKRKRKLRRLRNFFKFSKNKLKICLLSKIFKGKSKTRSFKIFKQSKRRKRKQSLANLNIIISKRNKDSSDDICENRSEFNRNQDAYVLKHKSIFKNIYNASTSRKRTDDKNNKPGPSTSNTDDLRGLGSNKNYSIKNSDRKSQHLKWITEQYMQDIGTTEIDSEQVALDTNNAKTMLKKMYKQRNDIQYTVTFKRLNESPQLITWNQAAIPQSCTCPHTRCFCIGLDEQPYVSIKKKNFPLDIRRNHWIIGMFLKLYRPKHRPPPASTFTPHLLAALEQEIKEYNIKGNAIKRGPEMCLARCPHYYKNVTSRLLDMEIKKHVHVMTSQEGLNKKQSEKSTSTPEQKTGMIPKMAIFYEALQDLFYKPEPKQVYNKDTVVNYAQVIYDSSSTTLRNIFKKSNSENKINDVKFKIEDIPSTSKQCNVQHSKSQSNIFTRKDTNGKSLRKTKPITKCRQRKKMLTITIDFKKSLNCQGDCTKKKVTINQNNTKAIKHFLASDKISREELTLIRKSIAVFNIFLGYIKKCHNKVSDNVNKEIKKDNDIKRKISTKEYKNAMNSTLNLKNIFFKKLSEKCSVSDKSRKFCKHNQKVKEKTNTKELAKHDLINKKELDNICKKRSEKCNVLNELKEVSNNNKSCKGKNITKRIVKLNIANKKDKLDEYKYKIKNITEDRVKHNIAKEKDLYNIKEKRSEKCSVFDKLEKKSNKTQKYKGENITEETIVHNIAKEKDLDNICEMEIKSEQNRNMELTRIVVDNNAKGRILYENRKDVKIDIPEESLQRPTTEVIDNNASSYTTSYSYYYDSYSSVSISHSECTTDIFSSKNTNLKFDRKLPHDAISGSSYYSDWWSPMNSDSCVLNVGHYVEERKTVTFESEF